MDTMEQYRLDERLANTIFYLWQANTERDRNTSLRQFEKLVVIEKRSRGAAAPFLRRMHKFIHQNYEDARGALAAHNGVMASLPGSEDAQAPAQQPRSSSVIRDSAREQAIDADAIARIIALEDFADWILGPIAPGDWRSMTEAKEPLLRAIAASHLVQVLHTIEGARWCHPSFYKGLSLVEVQLGFGDDHQIAAFYVTDLNTAFFNGTSHVVHELNATGRLVLTDETLTDYLQFFCLAVQGEEGPFRIVVGGADIPGWEELSEETRQIVAENVKELIVRRDEGNSDAYRVPACVKYSHSVFKVEFRVLQSGMVEMLEDEVVVDGVNIWREAFDSRGLRTLLRLKT